MEQLLGKLTVMLPLVPLLYVALWYATAYALVAVLVVDVVLELVEEPPQLESRATTVSAATVRNAENVMGIYLA
jgi:hypothetical protein